MIDEAYNMILTRTPLRISLAGGGSDLPHHYEEYGGAVCSFTINKYIYITAKYSTGLFPHKYRLVYSKVEECNSIQEIQHPIIRKIMPTLGPTGLDLDVMSDVPAGSGLGSSSAFTVGLLNAAHAENFSKHMLAEEACDIEIDKLKEPIGKQDQYAAAFGGLNLFEFVKDDVIVRPIQHPYGLRGMLHLIYVGSNRSASALLAVQSKQNNTTSLREMSALAQVAAAYLRVGELEGLGEVIRRGWELKRALSPSISNERIDTIITTALANGATGGKLLGAGGTGFILLFCPTESRVRMLEALSPLKLKYVPFDYDMEGSKVLYVD